MLGTFGPEPNPPLVNNQHLQTSNPKYQNQVMLPVAADSPNTKRSPRSHPPSCTTLGGLEQKVPSRWPTDAQSKGKEAELGHVPLCYGLFPWAVLSVKPGPCSLVRDTEGARETGERRHWH